MTRSFEEEIQATRAGSGAWYARAQQAVGGGLRWFSPFGPIRVDYGINPDRKKGEDFGAVNFSVGSPF